MIDSLAHQKLDSEDYDIFRKDMIEMLYHELEDLFGTRLHAASWIIFQYGYQLDVMRKPCCNKPTWLQVVLWVSAGLLFAKKYT